MLTFDPYPVPHLRDDGEHAMSTLDREPRRTSLKDNGPLHEPRIDPGQNMMNPQRLGPKLLPAKIPRGVDNTKAEKRMPVKR